MNLHAAGHTWIQTYSGKPLSLLAPRAEDICFSDIAIALSRAPRWAGHTSRFYSVAQHSNHVAQIVRDMAPKNYRAQLWGLLHDGHEAFTGDNSTPLKNAIACLVPTHTANPIKLLEGFLDNAIMEAAGLTSKEVFDALPLVHRADAIALATEKAQLMANGLVDWPLPEKPDDIDLDPESSSVAETRWLQHLGWLFWKMQKHDLLEKHCQVMTHA